ncbi:hypothetical protein HAZT_HAZT000415 [Hyalella azteca]|uniref:Uncharacterized protein n=1 Tax=Hyalella azteca TaxID=294128 RepID=A0A6A0HAN1_HYAAZ|nr:hypothetical protein HAZT_HAZT000415 [Hyalella azteca]
MIERFVPKVRNSGVQKKKWLDCGTLTSVCKKHKLYQRWLQTQAGEDYRAYAKTRNQAARACRAAKQKLEATIAAQAKNHPKSFWSYVQAKTKTRSGVADLRKEDGTKTTSDKEKAEILNNFFQSIFTEEKGGDLPDMSEYTYDRELLAYITPEIFIQLYKSLVRPVLEYGHSVWQPRHKTLCSDLEDVQSVQRTEEGNQAYQVSPIASLKDKPYPERLTSLRRLVYPAWSTED